MEDKVSIIIPAFNAEAFIERAIYSAINQTYKNIEIVAINDGSTDSTEKIIEKIAKDENRLKLISTTNGGVSKARNIGIENAEGDYICFLDADDILPVNSVEYMMQLMLENKADIVSGSFQHSIYKNDLENIVLTGEEALIKHIEDHPVGYSSCAKLYKLDSIRQVRCVEGRRINEDSFYVFECFSKVSKVVYTEQCVYEVIPSENSASRAKTFSDKYLDILYFAEEKVKLIKENFPQLSEKTNGILLKADMALLSVLSNYKLEKQYKQLEKQLIKRVIKNKRFFVPAIENDKKWFFIITHHLYGLYKFIKRIKMRAK